MPNLSPFCTCTDEKCPCHPSNHDQGCTLCVLKNQQRGEIPSCFFKMVDPEYRGPGYYIQDFANLVAAKNQEKDR